jgi:hypothetical protein
MESAEFALAPRSTFTYQRGLVAIYENATEFAGKQVQEWEEGIPIDPALAWRIRLSYEQSDDGISWTDLLAAFLEDPNASRVEALVVGDWGDVGGGSDSIPVIGALASARGRLPGLKALFLGDLTAEECEISWINHGDVSPLFEAYPDLECFQVRGAASLSLGSPRHAKLRQLIIQSGGLPPSVIHEIAAADLPALEHLELWLGDPSYGGDATVQDLAALLNGDRFAHLKYLGLKNSHIQDQVAAAVAVAAVTARLDVLDLSMGTLGDEGAKAMLASPAINHLKLLDIHHHYCSAEMVAALQRLGCRVDVSDAEGEAGEDDRYVAVSE